MTNDNGKGPVDEWTGPAKASLPHASAEGKKRRKRRRGRRGRREGDPAAAQSAVDKINENIGKKNFGGKDAAAQERYAPRERSRQENAVGSVAEAPMKPESEPCLDARPGGRKRDGACKRGQEADRRNGPKRKGRPFGERQGAFQGRPAYAALDLGTNNCRLLVAVPNGSSFRVVDAFSRIVRLGEGIASSGRLSENAMDRAVDALKVCAGKLNGRGIKRLRLIATEACRIAENGETFIERVRSEAGLELEIVNRETEARLAVAGCASLVDKQSDGVILFDIGGGSSELVWLDLKDRALSQDCISNRVRSWASLPVGVVNISERHGGVDVTPEIFEEMVAEVMGLLDRFPEADALSRMVEKGGVHMLGTSGTVTTLAGVHLGLDCYDRRKVDGIWMSSKDVSAMTEKLLTMSFDERSGNACIGRERADLVLAGCAILEALRRKWPCSRLRVADRGLREGILYELMSEDGVLRTAAPPGGRRSHRRRGGRPKPKTPPGNSENNP